MRIPIFFDLAPALDFLDDPCLLSPLRETLPFDLDFALELFDDAFPPRLGLESLRLWPREEPEDLADRPAVLAALFTTDRALDATLLMVFLDTGLAALRFPMALAAKAPTTPPTTVPTGPATLPITAPATAPAVSRRIEGIWMSSAFSELR